MCQEVIQMMNRLDQKSVETQLALQCAPLITGIKISNLLLISSENEAALRQILRHSGIIGFRMVQLKGKASILLFRKALLEEYLSHEDVRSVLASLGYQNFSLGSVLRNFRARYQAHMDRGAGFPHEMGLLLGYPTEDVIGFMNDRGNDSLYTGYWKVYSNVEEKKKIFREYDEAQNTIVQLLAEKIDFQLILQIFKPEYNQTGIAV